MDDYFKHIQRGQGLMIDLACDMIDHMLKAGAAILGGPFYLLSKLIPEEPDE
jgi:hypothetical protein